MSAAKHRYELWLNGGVAARYKTMGQALLGALWRSKKLQTSIYIWRAGKSGYCAATVRAGGV